MLDSGGEMRIRPGLQLTDGKKRETPRIKIPVQHKPLPFFECVEDVMAAVYRNMTPEKRLKAGLEMWRSARQILLCAFRSFHPDWTEAQAERKVAERMLRGPG